MAKEINNHNSFNNMNEAWAPKVNNLNQCCLVQMNFVQVFESKTLPEEHFFLSKNLSIALKFLSI